MATVNQINNIIVDIMVILNFAKDIHYSCKEYGDHLLSDRVIQDLDIVDDIKENILLGNNASVPVSSLYLSKASTRVPKLEEDVEKNFLTLHKLLDNLVKTCGGIKLDRGDSALIDNLCEAAKKGKALLWLRTQN